MSPRNWLCSWLSSHPHTTAHRPRTRLAVESLESRDVPSALSVSDATAIEGSAGIRFIDRFVAAGSGGLAKPNFLVFGPDGNQDGSPDLYVAGLDSNAIHRYDGRTGVFMDTFVAPGSGGLDQPRGIAFGPDGNLYVASYLNDQILKYDGATGAFLGVMAASVPSPFGVTFGPDGSLYIDSRSSGQVFRYQNGTLSTFVTAGSGGLSEPAELQFGPDWNADGVQELYVTSNQTGQVLRYNGVTGAFINVFTNPVPGQQGLGGLRFRADGYAYVSALTTPAGGSLSINRYSATTGVFVDTFAVGNMNWAFTFGPDGLLYEGNPSPINSVDRFGSQSLAAFTVTLDTPSASPVTVDYATASGTAVVGSDFTPVYGTITFAPGETTKTIIVPTINDAVVEGTETFTLTLSNPVGATISTGTGVGTITDDDATKFFVVNDGSPDQTYRYGAPGNGQATTALAAGNTAPRGAASTAAGDKTWVVDANKSVYVYSSAGALLGSWVAGSLNSTADVQGITVWGADVWLVDAKQDRVYRYAGAASRLSGSQTATSSFALNNSNSDPKDLVTDGTSVWVVNDSTTDKVFKYTLSGSLVGSWTMSGGGGSPTGITLDPTGASQDLWVVDNATDTVYRYAAARSLTSGSAAAASAFALNPFNTNPQGIADPPPPGDALAERNLPGPAGGVGLSVAGLGVPSGGVWWSPAGAFASDTGWPDAVGVGDPGRVRTPPRTTASFDDTRVTVTGATGAERAGDGTAPTTVTGPDFGSPAWSEEEFFVPRMVPVDADAGFDRHRG